MQAKKSMKGTSKAFVFHFPVLYFFLTRDAREEKEGEVVEAASKFAQRRLGILGEIIYVCHWMYSRIEHVIAASVLLFVGH